VTEPHSTTIVVVGGGFSLVAGSLFGLPLAALVFGLAGALAAIKLDRKERTVWARVTTVALGTMCAAAGAHPAATVLRPVNTTVEMWVPVAALVIGYGAEALLRTGLQGLLNRLRQIGGTSGGDTQ
jgi:hypothetical protein